MNKKYKLAAVIAGGYLFIGVFRIYGSAQISHYFLGDDEPLVLSAKEILSRAISLFASAGILFGITLLFTRRLYQAIDNHTALFQKDPNPLAVFNLDTLHYIRANPAFLSALGYTEKQVKFITIHDSENVAKTVQHLVLQNSTEFVSMGVWEVLLYDGTFAKIEASICLTRWDNVQRGLVRMHDVTQQQKDQQLLINLNEGLEKQVELRTRELAEMNQELQAYNEELHATNEAAIKANELIQQANAELSLVHSQLKIKSARLIEQSEEKLNKVLSSIREVVWTGHIENNQLHIDFVNEAFEALTGIPINQAIGSIVPAELMIPKLRSFIHSHKVLVSGVYEIEEEVESKNQKTNEVKWHYHRCWITVNTGKQKIRLDGTMSDVTARKLAEEAAHNQWVMMQDLVDNLPLMIMLTGNDGTIQYVNNRFGYADSKWAKPSDYVGKLYADYIELQQNAHEREFIAKLHRFEKQWIDYEGKAPNGQAYYMRWMRVPSTNGSYIHIGRDVTETRKLELDLQQQREQLQTIVDNLPQYVMLSDQHQQYRFLGKSYQNMYSKLTGRDATQDVIGLTETEFVHASYINQNATQRTTALELLETHGVSVEIPFISDHGEIIHISWHRIALPDGGFLSVGQDITQQKKLMADLEKQREMLQTLIENLPLKILFVDDHETIRFINTHFTTKNTAAFVGKPLEEFTATSFSDDETRQRALSVFRGSKDWTDFHAFTPTGREIYDSWITIPLSSTSYIAIGQDIRVRKKIEAEQNQLLEQLITQNNDLLQFSYIASHNLRGPVASILGLINLLEYNPNPESHHEVLKHVQNSINHLDSVISDMSLILEFRNIEAHQNEQVYLEQLVVLLIENFRPQLDACDIQVSIEVNVNWVYTIQSYLYSILHNLISNAIKYRDTGRASTIRIEAVQQNNEVLITVHDNGKGIDLDRFKDKLFSLYQRFDFDVMGKGLGLFMAKTQAEALGGRLVVTSEPGRGSSFTLSLPIIENVPAQQGA